MMYRLDENREPVLEPDLIAWGDWFEAADRSVARTRVGEAVVSTVFLGIDHQFGLGPPTLFETLILGGLGDGEGERYHTWADAEAGHARWVAAIGGAS